MEHIALVMAAGEGVRMRSDVPKGLHPLCGKSMLQHVMDTVGKVCQTVIPILGHGRDDVLKAMGDFTHCVQDFSTGKGTGHAVMCAAEHLKGRRGCVIVTAGDMPLVTEASYQALFDAVQRGAAAALLYDLLPDPFGYGRVVIDAQGKIQGIVEQKDLTEEQIKIQACNASVYCFDIESLLWALPQIENHNAANEFYLTDTIGILATSGRLVAPVAAQDHDECRGINTRVQLEEATSVMRSRINRHHMLAGVTLLDAKNTY
ncbi:MAG TPA: NTP transferase domain-containing protein, partial [Clostridia bacterium]|nr:NTP transferase domain-containing protein [Clostridia bacterium]